MLHRLHSYPTPRRVYDYFPCQNPAVGCRETRYSAATTVRTTAPIKIRGTGGDGTPIPIS